MIPIEELMYDIDLKLNKVGTNEHQGIELENKIIAINDAQINLIKNKFSENNMFKGGLDSFQKRYNDLEFLVERSYLELTPNNDPLKSYSADLSVLKPEYMLGIPGSEYIIADKDICKGSVLTVIQVKHGDVNTLLKNSNTAPSFEYQETIGIISNHKWQIFTDGTFTPKRIYLSHIRYPKKVDYEGYEHFDGSASTKEDSELPYYLKEELVDIAVKALALSTDNQDAVQASQIKIQTNE